MGKKVLLFFGFIRGYKGLDRLIKALAHLSDEYYLIIAGDVYGDFFKYQELIDEHNLSARIKSIVRYIRDEEAPALFSASDLCVLPYNSATQSGIVQIAFHYALPSIVTDVGGLAEMVEHNKTGFVLKNSDPKELAQQIRVYFDRQLYSSFSKNIDLQRDALSWKGFSETVMDLYNEIKNES